MKKKIIFVLCILALGIGLRLYQLGHDSLWYDEVNVALIALSSSISGVLSATRIHVMAMPLDYVIAWLMTYINLQEATLRFPAAVFGSLTLITYFWLCTRLIGLRVAMLATLLLAISPLHIQFSQELRFYAALVFFYTLSTALLVESFLNPKWYWWLLFTIFTTIGIYFHVYVLLVFITGGVWLALNWVNTHHIKRQIIAFISSVVVVAVASLPGLLYFWERQRFNFPILLWHESLIEAIGQGIGWLAIPYTNSPNAAWLWSLSIIFFGLIGIIYGLVKGELHTYILALSGSFQIGLIILMNVVMGYFLLYRQFIQLLPFTLIFTASGINITANWIHKRLQPGNYLGSNRSSILILFQKSRDSILAILIFIVLLISIPALQAYYRWPKSTAREISEYLIDEWSPGDVILVSPTHQVKTFRYYLRYVYREPELSMWLKPVTLERLIQNGPSSNEKYLIINKELTQSERDDLLSLGFASIEIPTSDIFAQENVFINHKQIRDTLE